MNTDYQSRRTLDHGSIPRKENNILIYGSMLEAY